MTKVTIYRNRIEVVHNGNLYAFDDFNIRKDEDYWNTLGEETSPDARDINIWYDEGWAVNLYPLYYDKKEGRYLIDSSGCELVTDVKVVNKKYKP